MGECVPSNGNVGLLLNLSSSSDIAADDDGNVDSTDVVDGDINDIVDDVDGGGTIETIDTS